MYDFNKRLIDLVMVLVLAIPALVIVGIAAVLVRLDSKGRMFFAQKRIGKDGIPFLMFKIRSMYETTEHLKHQIANDHSHNKTFKHKSDPRTTRVGKWIRKLSIDELPQLWNVLVGDMSFVGPRPALPQEVEQYTEVEKLRLQVKPGLTGIWQTSGRADLCFDRQFELDLEYIAFISIWLDIVIILKTVPAVLTGRGAY